MASDQSLHTIWHTGDLCPECGHAIATNGRTEWCTGCDTAESEPTPTNEQTDE